MMIQCHSGACRNGWFHVSCASVYRELPDDYGEDWYCSSECSEDESYIYCVCQRKEDSGTDDQMQMIQCSRQGSCRGREWYHISCMGFKSEDQLPATWYCGEACQLEALNDDHVLNHSRALTFEGLRNLCRRAAVQAGDGAAMLDDWKMDLLQLWNGDHTRSLTDAHHFLACVGGFAPESVRHRLIWNRVVNMHGGSSENIGLDLCNERIQRDFKGILSHSTLNITGRSEERCAKMCGPLSLALDTCDILNTTELTTPCLDQTVMKRSKAAYKEDLRTFVGDYTMDCLFDYVPLRQHKSFERFDNKATLRDPGQLGRALRELSEGMDAHRAAMRGANLCEEDQSLPSESIL